MYENEPLPPHDEHRWELARLLSADFTPAEPSVSVAQGSALHVFISRINQARQRYDSLESDLLRTAVEKSLEPAPITEALKSFIVDAVRRAHAAQTAVDDAVAPDRLGLNTDHGIFDPLEAPEIEGEILRGFLFDIHRRFAGIPEDETATIGPVAIYPESYRQAISTFVAWESDFNAAYGRSAFDGTEMDAFLDIASHFPVLTEAEEPGWSAFLHRLKRARGSD